MRFINLCTVLLLALLGQSCLSNSTLVVEKDANRKKGTAIDKIISIDPSYLLVDTRKAEDYTYVKSDAFNDEFNQLLQLNARRCDIQLQLVGGENLNVNNLDYYNSLLPLRQQIMMANFTQNVTYDGGIGEATLVKPATNYFENPPAISTAFSFLSKEYGTPYFAVHGVYSEVKPRKGKLLMLVLIPPIGLASFFRPVTTTYYYQVVVNVETGDTIYREIRRADSRAGKDNLDAMLYDSFNILNTKK